ncbi:hypothetical protein ACVIGB_006614 [Bradyrhizobium sp. USDA 4341]
MLTPDQTFICTQLGVVPSAHPDVELQFESAGSDASFADWLQKQRSDKSHWFKLEADDGLEILYSLKAQADHVRQHGEAQTRALLAANGLTLGKIKPRPSVDPAKLEASQNPWHSGFRGDRHAKIASMIKSGMSMKAIAEIAAAAGRTISGDPIRSK